jgi:hypothetical protein
MAVTMARKKDTRKIAVIDCETDPFGWNPKKFDENEVHPFVWGFYSLSESTYHEFWNDNVNEYGDYSATRKLVEFLQGEDYIIYAHNGGKFDFMFLLPWLDEDITLVNGRIAKATLGTCELRDSFMILPVPLSAMEKQTGFDYETKMHYARRHLYRDEISTYLKSDCKNLAEWVGNFITRYGVKFTLASTSMMEIKNSGYNIIKMNEKHDEKFRPYFFGGRVQCFQKGKFTGPLQYVDINSAYPYAMLHNHPTGGIYTEFKDKLPKRGRNTCYFATILAVSSGCLPLRDADGKLIYHTDNVAREYNATGWEIEAGLDTGTLDIKKVIIGYRYISIANFEKFILGYYALKNASEKGSPEYLFSKLIMNAGFGKWGMNPREFKAYKLMPYGQSPPKPKKPSDGPEFKPYADHFEYSVWYAPDPDMHGFYNVATAASITGFVRAYLWRHICASKGVIYCDTDSLICTEFSGQIGNMLGEWSLECVVDTAWIAQRKMYCLLVDSNPWKSAIDEAGKLTLWFAPQYKIASKGVRLSPQEIIDGVEFGGKVNFQKPSPAFSVKYGQRFLEKSIDFSS